MTNVRRAKDEQGVAAIVALLVLVVVLLLSAAVVSAAVDLSTGSRRDTSEKRAFEAAQAGLQQTLYRFNELINTQSFQASALSGFCMGANSSGREAIQSPSASYNSTACVPYTESLGNGAFYTSWTSVAYTSGVLICAGQSIAITTFFGERCLTSEGIICPPSFTSVSQLPCPNPVIHRTEERVSANTGKPVFQSTGITAPNGIWIQNNTTISGTVNTNGELYISGNASVTQGEQLAPGGPWPSILNNNASLAACQGRNYPAGTTSWPSTCVNRVTTQFSLASPQYPYVNCTGNAGDTTCPNASGSWNYQLPDGDQMISNAFLPCAQPGASPSCAHDQFTGCSTASSCGWNAQSRTLSLPNGVTWLLTGSAYDLCTLQLTGSGTAKLAAGLRTSIYVDSPRDTSPAGPACPSGTGLFVLGNQSQFINTTPSSAPGIAYDTTALQIYIYGTSTSSGTVDYNHNDCINPPASACIQLGQSSTFYGTVDAPNSDILMANSAGTYGSVEGRTVTYANTGFFITDQTDANIKTYALGVYYRTLWHDCGVQFATAADPMSNC